MKYQIGGLVVTLTGDSKYADAFRSYFALQKVVEDNQPAQLIVNISESPLKPMSGSVYYSLSGKMQFKQSSWRCTEKQYEYTVTGLFDRNDATILELYFKEPSAISRSLRMMTEGAISYGNYPELLTASVMAYKMFWLVFAITLLKNDKLFVHGSATSIKNQALLICGTGGCGKTSMLFELMKTHAKYISEDFCILDQEGLMHLSPRKMTIYESDIAYGNPMARNAYTNLSRKCRLLWNGYKLIGHNPRMVVTPLKVFNQRQIIQNPVCLSRMVYVLRKNVDKPRIMSASHEEIAQRAMHASFRELKELYELLNNIQAVSDKRIRDSFPDISVLQENYKERLLEAISGVDTCLVEAPLKIPPKSILDIIKR